MEDARETTHLTAENPWPALLSFREEDSLYFGGRDDEIEEMFRRVSAEQLTLLFGMSGVGKTSLLRAGLFPRLRQAHYFPVYIRLDFEVSDVSLIDQIFRAIADQARRWEVEAPPRIADETLWEYFHRREADFWDRQNFSSAPVLVFDQFEEIFTKGRHLREAEVTEVFDQLADLADGELPLRLQRALETDRQAIRPFARERHHYRLVFGMRADHLAQLDNVGDRFRSIFLNRFPVGRMSGEAALRGTLRASRHRHLMTETVARRIVRFVAGIEDDAAAATDAELPVAKLQIEPALLSVFCSELNRTRLERKQEEITGEMLRGRKDDILRGFYDLGFKDLPEAMRTFVEDELISSDGAMRNFVSEQTALQYPGVTAAGLRLLVARKIIRLDETDRKVELTHDLLVGVAAARRRERQLEMEKHARLAAERRARRSLAFAAVIVLICGTAVLALWKWYKLTLRTAQAEARSSYRLALQAFDADHPGEGLAYLAMLLRRDSGDTAAQSLVYDQIVSRRWPIMTGSFKPSLRVPGVAMSANNRVIAFGIEGEVEVWDATGKALTPRIAFPRGHEVQQISDDGRFLLLSAPGIGKPVFDVSKRKLLPTRNVLDLASDGTIAAREGDAIVFIRGESRTLVHAPREAFAGGAFTADGRHFLVYTSLQRTESPTRDGFRYAARLWSRDASDFAGPAVEVIAGPAGFAITPDGRRISTFTGQEEITTFDLVSGKAIGPPIHSEGVELMAMSPAGSSLLTYSPTDGTRLWSLPSGRAIGDLGRYPVTAMAFSEDGLRILTGTSSGEVRCWSATTGELLAIPFEHRPRIAGLGFAADGSIFSVANDVRTWRLRSAVRDPVLRVSSPALASNASRTRFAVRGEEEDDLTIVDQRGVVQWRMNLRPEAASPGDESWESANLSIAGVSADGSLVAFLAELLDASHLIVVQRAGNGGKKVFDADLPSEFVSHAQFTGDSRYLIVEAGSHPEARLTLFSTSNWRSTPLDAANGFLAGDTGRLLATSDNRGIRIWDLTARKLVGSPLAGPGVEPLAFTPGDRFFVARGRRGNLLVWTLPGLLPVRGLPELDEVDAVAAVPGGNMIGVTAGGGVHLIETGESWKKVGEVPTSGDAESIAFSSDGTRLMASIGSHVEIWDVHDPGEPRPVARTIMKAAGAPAAMTADGGHVFTIMDNALTRHDLATFGPDDSALLAEIAETLGGAKVTEIGQTQPVDARESTFASIVTRCGANREGACRIAAWLAESEQLQTLSPFSHRRLADYVRATASRSEDSWVRMATLFPGHPALGPKPAPLPTIHALPSRVSPF